jgi:hypothetical protein
MPAVVVSTVTVACPSAKSRVAFATGVPSADFSCVVRLSVPGAGLLEVVEELDGLDDWFDVQALNTATGAVSRAAATVTCFNMTAAYPEPPSGNRAPRVYPPAKQDDGPTVESF